MNRKRRGQALTGGEIPANATKENPMADETLELDHDKLIGEIAARNAEDQKRASSAGESRQLIKDFLEGTDMNAQAFSWCRRILKINEKDDGQAKAMDVIRSLKAALPMIEAHVEGQGTGEMDFDKPAEPAKKTAEKPAKAKTNRTEPAPADDVDDGVEEGQTVDVEDDERVEFNEEVDETLDGDGNVMPFGARG